MTKLEKLKEEIGYTKEVATCQNCRHFTSDIVKGRWNQVEKNIRCGKHNFATKKMTTCNDHERK